MSSLSRRTFFVLSLASLASILLLYTSHGRFYVIQSKGINIAREERLLNITHMRQDADAKDPFLKSNQTLSNRKVVDITRAKTIISTTSSSVSDVPNPNCKKGPVRNIMFLKTHKTGSSTVQNVLMRHAHRENLFIGLPKQPIFFNYNLGIRFNKTFMKATPPGRIVNMLIHHMVFDHSEVASVLPKDTTFLTILRDPATQFESIFHYLYDHAEAFERVNWELGVAEFVRRPERYFKGPKDGSFWWLGKNNVLYDLGFDNMNETEEYMRETTEKMDNIFDFVLIAEYFDISLLLLKDLLCWDIKDMVYLSMNARNRSTVEYVTDDVKENIYKWNKADTSLYKYYNQTFWKKVQAYGKIRLENDLKLLEKLKNEVKNYCVEDGLVSSKDIKTKALQMHNPPGLDITQYKLKPQAMGNETCLGIILPEKMWYRVFDRRQYPRPRRPEKIVNPGAKPQIGFKIPFRKKPLKNGQAHVRVTRSRQSASQNMSSVLIKK